MGLSRPELSPASQRQTIYSVTLLCNMAIHLLWACYNVNITAIYSKNYRAMSGVQTSTMPHDVTGEQQIH